MIKFLFGENNKKITLPAPRTIPFSDCRLLLEQTEKIKGFWWVTCAFLYFNDLVHFIVSVKLELSLLGFVVPANRDFIEDV